MKKTIAALMAAATLATSTAAIGEDRSATLGVNARTISAGGITKGCSIEFTQIAYDATSGPERPVMLNGSLETMVAGGHMFLVFRLAANDTTSDPANGEDMFTPAKLDTIALYDADGHSNVATRIGDFDDGTPGTRTTMFLFEERNLEVVRGIADDHRLTASFNRRAGARDVRFTVDLDAPRTDGLDAVSGFMTCMKDMTEQDPA